MTTGDDTHGPAFESRLETLDEYRSRSGSTAGPGALVPTDTYRVVAGFAEHDERLGAKAAIELTRPSSPSREEAETAVWPAVHAETVRALGEGDWWPSINWIDVIRLLADAPDVAPASMTQGFTRLLRRQPLRVTDFPRAAVAAFAERYAASRGLSYAAAADGPAPTAPWEVAKLHPPRSHSFMRGHLALGPEATLWFGDRLAHTGRGNVRWARTVVLYQVPVSMNLACVARGPGASALPAGLHDASPAAGADAGGFLKRYEVGAGSDDDAQFAARLLTPALTTWLAEQADGKAGARQTSFEVQGHALAVYAEGSVASAPDLDAFCERSARIATAVIEAQTSP